MDITEHIQMSSVVNSIYRFQNLELKFISIPLAEGLCTCLMVIITMRHFSERPCRAARKGMTLRSAEISAVDSCNGR